MSDDINGQQITNIFTEDNINFNNEIYNLKVYLDTEYITFHLELIHDQKNNILQKKFIKKITNSELGIIEPAFQNYDLNNNFAEIYDKLNDKKYKIERNDDNVKFIIKKNMCNNITFVLNEEIEDENINYTNLSDEMKNIIDKNELIIGIDLGTTYSCASVFIDNKTIIISNSLGTKITASYVAFLSKDKVCVGNFAKLYPTFGSNIIYNVKRLIGRSYNDKEIKDILEKKLLTYEIIEDKEFNALKIKIKLDDDSEIYYYPEQITALILKQIVSDSEYYLTKRIGKKINIKNVVITIPAYFNQKQRKATKNAALIADLNVKGMINEPTAACLAYCLDSLENKEIYIIVIDFGGGTLDITLIKYEKSIDGNYCVVKFTYGDSNFGGDDFDNILMEHCLEKRKEKNINKNLPENIRLKEACENAKIKLSEYKSIMSDKSVKYIIEEYKPKEFLKVEFTQAQFDDYCENLYQKFKDILKNFKKDCGIKLDKIKEVILIGRTTFLPKIEEIIGEEFGKNKIKNTLDRKEAVTIGASILGAKISNLSKVNNIKLLDVTNLSLGVNIQGDKMSKIIERSSPIPVPGINYYQTVYDNQTNALIKVFEGENEDNSKNLFLGEFRINIPKKKAGEVKITVKFEIDKFSLLKVTATEKENRDNCIEKIYAYDANEKEIKEIIASNNLQIIEPKNIAQIIDQLRINIQFIEFEIIKDSIIEKEDQILALKKKIDKYIKNIKIKKQECKELIKEKEDKIEELIKKVEPYKENIKILKQQLLQIYSKYAKTLLQLIYDMEQLAGSKKDFFFFFIIFFKTKNILYICKIFWQKS